MLLFANAFRTAEDDNARRARVRGGGPHHAGADLQFQSPRQRQLRRRRPRLHLDARLGQPRRARARAVAVQRQQALSAAERARVRRAPVRHLAVHAADLRADAQSGARLQYRLAPRVRAVGSSHTPPRLAIHPRSTRLARRRNGVYVLLLPVPPRPRAPQSDLVFLDPAVARCHRPVDRPAVMDAADHRLSDRSSAGVVCLVSGGADCRR